MQFWKSIFLFLVITNSTVHAQDTFSIVAVDSVTGEVGSAGASCVNLFLLPSFSDDFLGQLVPGVGAINTQAFYDASNQTNATNRMNLGETPSQIIAWLIANDFNGSPDIRQYGISALVNGSPQSAAHTGSNTNDFKGQIVGPNYAIQGNILLGQQILDSMEARFLAEDGDLACKLMAALQGANIVGADTRCASNGTSSLFAFVKVAQPTDTFGSPSFLESVKTIDGDGIEPIDSLQIKFDLTHSCGSASLMEEDKKPIEIYPNPTNGMLTIELNKSNTEKSKLKMHAADGTLILESEFINAIQLDLSSIEGSLFYISIETMNEKFTQLVIKE